MERSNGLAGRSSSSRSRANKSPLMKYDQIVKFETSGIYFKRIRIKVSGGRKEFDKARSDGVATRVDRVPFFCFLLFFFGLGGRGKHKRSVRTVAPPNR